MYELSKNPDVGTESLLASKQRFNVLLYVRTTYIFKVIEARQYLFTKIGRSLELIRPTKAALKEYVMRTIYQGWIKQQGVY